MRHYHGFPRRDSGKQEVKWWFWIIQCTLSDNASDAKANILNWVVASIPGIWPVFYSFTKAIFVIDTLEYLDTAAFSNGLIVVFVLWLSSILVTSGWIYTWVSVCVFACIKLASNRDSLSYLCFTQIQQSDQHRPAVHILHKIPVSPGFLEPSKWYISRESLAIRHPRVANTLLIIKMYSLNNTR